MKTFDKITVGDRVYSIDDDYRIMESPVVGIEDINLLHEKVSIKLLNKTSIIADFGSVKTTKLLGTPNASDGVKGRIVSYFSNYETAVIERNNVKEWYAEKQFRLALQAFRRMKKAIPDVSVQRKRVLEFFQILENEEN